MVIGQHLQIIISDYSQASSLMNPNKQRKNNWPKSAWWTLWPELPNLNEKLS